MGKINSSLLENKQRILYAEINLNGATSRQIDNNVYMILAVNYNYQSDTSHYTTGLPSEVSVYTQDNKLYLYVGSTFTSDKYIRIAYVKA